MVRQYVVPETGHRADGAYPKRRALIHLDGARYHDPDADRDLDNRHAALGSGRIDPDELVGVVREAGAPVISETPGGASQHRAEALWVQQELAKD